MSITLIPVVEIFFINEKLPSPTGNRWNNPKEWEAYELKCQLTAGLSKPIKRFPLVGDFYKLQDLTKEAIKMIVDKKLKEIIEDETLTLEDLSSLYGGFVLQENGVNLLFPQCCGTIKDFQHWKNAANGNIQLFWVGHPEPKLTQTKTTITFDCQEPNPPFVKTKFTIQKEQLKIAIKEVEPKLLAFEQKINALYPNIKFKNLGRKLLYN